MVMKDRETDRQTRTQAHGYYRACIASRGKKCKKTDNSCELISEDCGLNFCRQPFCGVLKGQSGKKRKKRALFCNRQKRKGQYDTIRYDTKRGAILMSSEKLTRVSLIYRTEPTT